MIRLKLRTALQAAAVLAVVSTPLARAGEWTAPVEVRHDEKRSVSYRARLNGEHLVVEASHEPGWHSNAMDNNQRAAEKLAGKPSLGVDAPTEIRVSRGLELAGPWFQSPPRDASRPELQWFTWVHEKQALFVAKVRRTGTGPALIAIEGQACTDKTCKKVEVTISLPLTGGRARADIDWKALVPVRPAKSGS